MFVLSCVVGGLDKSLIQRKVLKCFDHYVKVCFDEAAELDLPPFVSSTRVLYLKPLCSVTDFMIHATDELLSPESLPSLNPRRRQHDRHTCSYSQFA